MRSKQFLRRARRLLLWLILAFAGGTAVGVLFALLTDLPEVKQLENYQAGGITTLYDRQGRVLWEISAEKRRFLPLEKIPRLLQQAVLVTEDIRFFEHSGVDFLGIARALAKDIYRGRLAEGGSTITQQLTKVLFLNADKNIGRKLKEALLAIQIERKYTKRQIFEMYLNQIYYGSGAYGIYQAADTFFGRSPGELRLLEWCLLAGIPKNPAGYSPLYHRDRAEGRARLILDKLYKGKLISMVQRDQALRQGVKIIDRSWEQRGGSHLRAMLVQELLDRFGENLVYKGGVTVQTTIDASLQEVAERAVQEGVSAYQKRHPAARGAAALPEAALLARQVRSGEILALVGGRDFEISQFNRAVMARRQPGSAFKPLVVAQALRQGYTPSTIVGDFPVEFSDGRGGVYSPVNYDEEYLGFMPLRLALEKSRNTVAVSLASKVGISGVRQLARALGIDSPVQLNLSSALGSSSVTLRELVGAYGAIANGGIRVNDTLIREVFDRNGQSLWRRNFSTQVALEAPVAFVLSDMLRGVILSGTGREAADLPCWVAGKTGTTNDYRDAMFLGYSSQVAAGVWIGFDDNRPLGQGETGGVAALPMWKEFMAAQCALQAPPAPQPPEEVVIRRIDHQTGLLASNRCSGLAIDAAFIRGQEPRQLCRENVDLSTLVDR